MKIAFFIFGALCLLDVITAEEGENGEGWCKILCESAVSVACFAMAAVLQCLK